MSFQYCTLYTYCSRSLESQGAFVSFVKLRNLSFRQAFHHCAIIESSRNIEEKNIWLSESEASISFLNVSFNGLNSV